MTDVAATSLDGNAIAGLLAEVFGEEMTNETGVCGSCGASRQVGTFTVYLRAPGTVARCPTCAAVLMVVVTVRGVTCVDLRGLASLGSA
jgi:hypothetical protein